MKKCVVNESGSVESALTLIPLLFLFLVTIQLATSVGAKIVQSHFVQGEVSYSALQTSVESATNSGSPTDSSMSRALGNPSTERFSLSGGGVLELTSYRANVATILPDWAVPSSLISPRTSFAYVEELGP